MDNPIDPIGSPKKNKQSKYFELLQSSSSLKSSTSDIPVLRSPFSNHKRCPSSSSSSITPLYDDNVDLSFNSTSNTIIPDPSLRPTGSSRFCSSSSASSSPKSNSKSTPVSRRFSKNRLNNVENKDYAFEFNKTPIIPSPQENSFPLNQYDFDASLVEPESPFSFFKQPMLSPTESSGSRSNMFDYPNLTPKRKSQSSLHSPPKSIPSDDDLPSDMKFILYSRPESNEHNMRTFKNQSYNEFWNLSPEEGKVYKDWNKSEFDIQSLLFEVFTNLKKIRFNLHRLIFIYGAELKDTGVLSLVDYDKTFEVLTDFYYYLDKLLIKKLKPLFDNHFFVNATKVLKCLNNWFKQLSSQYRHISGSVVFLSKFSSNEDIKELIVGISKKDLENQTNRNAVPPLELFNSYFIKLFTSIALLFNKLKSTYKNINSMKNYELSSSLESTVKNINNISNSTSDLQKKINFNEKLTFNSETDYSKFQMVDMFDERRIAKEPMKLEIKNNINWSTCLIAAFDNYLTIFGIKSNTISLNKKDEYALLKSPIPIRYLEYDTFIDGNYKIIVIKDIGSRISYTFRKTNDRTVAILDRYLKDITELQKEFWSSNLINSKIDVKFLNSNSFISKTEDYSPFKLTTVPKEFDYLQQKVNKNDRVDNLKVFEPMLTDVLSCDTFYMRINSKTEKYCIVGTSFGIFIGKANNSSSFRKVHHITHVKKLQVLHNEILIFISKESLYKILIDKLFNAYKFDLPPCDINIFDENKRYVSDFTVGYQSSVSLSNSGSPYLFTWSNKLVNYTELRRSKSWKFNWQSFKTPQNILKLQTVYANNFAVGSLVDNCATWSLSKLSDIRASLLNNLDIKDILKNEIPIGIFPFPNEIENISEILVVYSKFCVRMKNVKGKYIQSNEEIIWFGMKCESATFDCEEKILITVNKQMIEVRSLFDNHKLRSELIACITGNNISLINDMPGTAIIKAQEIQGNAEFKREIVFRIKKLNDKERSL